MKEINEVIEAINEGNEAINESNEVINEGNEESIQMGVSKEKVKKPRSIKQQEALKKAQAARKLKLEQKRLEKQKKEKQKEIIPEKIPDDSEGEAGVEEYEQKYIIEKKKKPQSLKKKNN